MKLEKLKVGDLAQTLRLIHKDTGANAFVCNAAADVLEGMEKAQDVLQSNLDNNLAELARINEMLEQSQTPEHLMQQSKAWSAVCAALNKAEPTWIQKFNQSATECAVNAIEQLAAKAERLEQHCTYRSKTWGAVCRALDKACPDWSNTLNPEDATAAAVKAIEQLGANVSLDKALQQKANAWGKVWACLDHAYPGWLALAAAPCDSAVKAITNLASDSDNWRQSAATLKPNPEQKCSIAGPGGGPGFIGRVVINDLSDFIISSGGGGQATILGEGFSGAFLTDCSVFKFAEEKPKKLGPVISAFPYKHECFKDYPYLLLGHFWDSLQAVLKVRFPNTNEQRVVLLEDVKALVKREFEARLNKAFGNAKDLQVFEKLCNEFEWV